MLVSNIFPWDATTSPPLQTHIHICMRNVCMCVSVFGCLCVYIYIHIQYIHTAGPIGRAV
jgi:hypothetical protein